MGEGWIHWVRLGQNIHVRPGSFVHFHHKDPKISTIHFVAIAFVVFKQTNIIC
jgi:hypothetical protein